MGLSSHNPMFFHPLHLQQEADNFIQYGFLVVGRYCMKFKGLGWRDVMDEKHHIFVKRLIVDETFWWDFIDRVVMDKNNLDFFPYACSR